MNQQPFYAAPDTRQRKADWRDEGPCLSVDPELFFPKGDSGPWKLATAQAKAVCGGCPVRASCLQFAFDEGINYGIFGGLTEKERASLQRRTARKARTQSITRAPKEPPPKTLEEAFARRTRRTDDGHVAWQGGPQMKFQGRIYSALQLAFTFGHGRAPVGLVDRTCDRVCFAPEHLIDRAMVDAGVLCGTRRGYYQHLRVRKPACGPCRQANADADNRLRRTGTTRVAA